MALINIYSDMDAQRFDIHVAINTGFHSMADLLASRGSYRPSCDCRIPFMRSLAYRFDSAMYALGDDRRAYLYGSEQEKDLARWGR